MLAIVIAVIATVYTVLSPMIMNILDVVVTLIFTVAHGGMVFVIKNVMDAYMIKEKTFFYVPATGQEDADIVCNIILTYLPIFRTIAISVIILIAAWQLFKVFFEYAGFSTEVEEPWKIGIKLMIFSALILESKAICQMIIRIFEGFISEIEIKEFNFDFLNQWADAFTGTNLNIGEGIVKYVQEGVFKVFLQSFAPKLIIFMILLIIDAKLLSVVIDFAEKYLQVGFLIIISPLVFACGVSKSTSQILTSWVKLMTGTLFGIFIKLLLMKILLEKGIGFVQTTNLDIRGFVGIIRPITLMIAFTSIIEQSDQLTRELGFTVGSSSRKASDSLSRVIGRVMKS